MDVPQQVEIIHHTDLLKQVTEIHTDTHHIIRYQSEMKTNVLNSLLNVFISVQLNDTAKMLGNV